MGKTTVSVNLAYSLARRGWNTLLVDTDPQGSVGLSLSEKARKCQGFYDAVHTGVSVLPLILPTRLPELNLLTAGQSHSFFGSGHESMDTLAALRRMVAEIATRPFDLVIFDTPATNANADALTVGAAAGYALVVARRNFSFFNDVSTLVSQLASARCPVIGSVLNEF